LIVSKAPGAAAEQSGMPFDDSSGDHLRHWLRVNKNTIYNKDLIAFLPMAF
jgi:uracil-DNA glycosylase